MFKRFKERTLVKLVFTFLIGLFAGMQLTFISAAEDNAHVYLNYFHRVYQLLQTEYVDVPDNKKIFFGAIKGMISSLDDPFSRFLDKQAYSELTEITTGKFVGVGIQITIRDNEIVVVSPLADSPAMKVGIQSGDIITEVDGTSIKDKSLSEIVKLIKGLPNTKVKLTINRQGYEKPLYFDVTREPIKIKSVDSGVINDENIGYISIKTFGGDTSADVREALESFNKKNISKLILDLRYNPGGLLSSAVEISDFFLEKGKVVVSTRGRSGKDAEEIFKSENDAVFTGEIIVLVNNGSASASEIVSGALRDNKRALLLGIKTFGKGSVQKTFQLDKDLGVAITIAKYYTPSGELIHKKGIKPDIEVPLVPISDMDKKAIERIMDEKLLDDYVKPGMDYTDNVKQGFREILEKKKIQISEYTGNYLLKKKIDQYRKGPLYDLEFDNQLREALKKLGK